MTRSTLAHIDLGALAHNFQIVKSYAPHCAVMAVIKADAYGHGAVPVAQTLAHADSFAVAFLEEAIELREAGIEKPIVLLEGLFKVDELRLACQHELELVVHRPDQVSMLESCRTKTPLIVWLKLDTGMHRIGVSPTQFLPLYRRLQAINQVCEIRLMSHLACADQTSIDATERQCAVFDQVTADIRAPVSLANSAALMAWPQTRRDWVRPGLMLYGASPFDQSSQHSPRLRPVMTMKSELIAIREVEKGETVGYGGAWVAQQNTLIGTVAIGYADGYPRALPSGTPALIQGKRVELAGRVSMDMISLDLSNCPQALLGDEVVLWGQGLPVEEIAARAGTIAYELLTGVSQRVPRKYR